jgi:hypothetical protein
MGARKLADVMARAPAIPRGRNSATSSSFSRVP